MRLATLVLVVVFLAPGTARARIVPLSSPGGKQRLARLPHSSPYFSLSRRFEYQLPCMCGPTSAANVLRALKGGRISQKMVPRRGDKTVSQIMGLRPVRRDGVELREPGMGLRQLAALLGSHGVRASASVVADDRPTRAVRDRLRRELHLGRFVVTNFFSPSLGQTGGGHFSPLGGYDRRSNSFLVMDVAREHGWYWVDAGDLVRAMRTRPAGGDENRGFICVAGPPGTRRAPARRRRPRHRAARRCPR